ncbi:MAG: glycosyltransferase family 4 protein [Leptospiraceae bacterium]|nr:glycosyltransferase family 4 protein [Leptospiraceae bacterium]
MHEFGPDNRSETHRTLSGDSRPYVALVVQRFHPDIAGGAEQHAWLYARYLQTTCNVDLLTTTAKDSSTWANVLPSGVEHAQGVRIVRFPVQGQRDSNWKAIHDLLLRIYHSRRAEPAPVAYDLQAEDAAPIGVWEHRSTVLDTEYIPWSIAMQEEWLRRQGPYSPLLVEYLERHHPVYDAIIYFTYLYAPVYYGSAITPASKNYLVPTLHPEPPAYLPILRRLIRNFRCVLWNTVPEQRLGERIWPESMPETDHKIIGMGIDCDPAPPAKLETDYVLYAGRIDAGKGCAELVEFFIRYSREAHNPVRLILIGTLQMSLPKFDSIEYRGFVEQAEKLALMAGARALLMPSRVESLSIVSLEAMAQGTPVLAHAGSAVVHGHIENSGAGAIYNDFASFKRGMDELIQATDGDAPERIHKSAMEYVLNNYSHALIRSRLLRALFADRQDFEPDK